MNKIGIGGVYISETGKKYVNEALDAQHLSAGEMVYKFEKRFAELHEQKYGIALNSGTSALHVGLEALKEKFGWSIKTGGIKKSYSFCNNIYSVVKFDFARGTSADVR